MKNLARVLFLAGLLSLPFGTSKAQDKNEKEENSKSIASLFIGSYKPTNEESNKKYGALLKFGGGFGANISKNLRIEGRLGLISTKSQIKEQQFQGDFRYDQSYENNLSITEISAVVSYLVPYGSGCYYIGAGVSFTNADEKADGTLSTYRKTTSGIYTYYPSVLDFSRKIGDQSTQTGIGGGLFIGNEFNLFGDMRLFLEASGRFLTNDFSGLTLKGGIRYGL